MLKAPPSPISSDLHADLYHEREREINGGDLTGADAGHLVPLLLDVEEACREGLASVDRGLVCQHFNCSSCPSSCTRLSARGGPWRQHRLLLRRAPRPLVAECVGAATMSDEHWTRGTTAGHEEARPWGDGDRGELTRRKAQVVGSTIRAASQHHQPSMQSGLHLNPPPPRRRSSAGEGSATRAHIGRLWEADVDAYLRVVDGGVLVSPDAQWDGR